MILLGYFNDQFLDTFGHVVCVLERCVYYFSVFLFIKLIIDMLVIFVRYMKIDKITGSPLGFGKTLLSASHGNFLTNVLISMYSPRPPVLAAVGNFDVDSRIGNSTLEVKEDAKKKEEHFLLLLFHNRTLINNTGILFIYGLLPSYCHYRSTAASHHFVFCWGGKIQDFLFSQCTGPIQTETSPYSMTRQHGP